jgi:predicted peptidase
MSETTVQVVESAPLRYLVSIPQSSGHQVGPWPLLCFLHGFDEAAPLDIRKALTRHGPLRPGNPRIATDRFVILAPQLPPFGGDAWYEYAHDLREIVQDVQQTHGTDPQRAYLTGFSYGGNGVLDLGWIQKDLWAALWPVDPTRAPQHASELPIWLSFGEISRRRKQAFIQALDLDQADRALDLDHVYFDQDQDHVGSARMAYQDERIYAWLLSKQA